MNQPIKLVFLTFLLTLGGQAMAAENSVWRSSSGSVWTDSDGDCWSASLPGDTTGCGEAPAPAPEPEEETGKFWAADNDLDGVTDKEDDCWFTPEGVAVDSKGCALDDDNDGVPNYLDKCPGTAPNTTVNLDGCPMVLFTLDGILFAYDSAALTARDKRLLDQAIPKIKQSSSSQIDVIGHTDSRGSDTYNYALSGKRAQSVVDYLVANGVSASRLNAFGRGESEPVASNDTAEGRQQNRRVELIAR